ncbi:MAG: hypothetical protein Q9200_007758 [Gallowayella weberi]
MIRSSCNNFNCLTFGLIANRRKKVDAHLDPKRHTKRPRNAVVTERHDTTTTGSLASSPDTWIHGPTEVITTDDGDSVISLAGTDTSASGGNELEAPMAKTAIKKAATNHDLKASTDLVASGHTWSEQPCNLYHDIVAPARVRTENIVPVMAAADGIAIRFPARQSFFPLMKLPRELRDIAYTFHSQQFVRHPTNCWCDHYGCRWRRSVLVVDKRDAAPENLWLVSKQLYNEAMPIYFNTHQFCFSNLGTLSTFIATSGPLARQHIANLCFYWEASDSISTFNVHQTFRLLSECPNLKRLTLNIPPSHLIPSQYRSLPGQRTALRIRGLKDIVVKISGPDSWVLGLDFPQARSRLDGLVERLSVLKTPYTDAEIKHREALGIIKKEMYRTCFDREEKGSEEKGSEMGSEEMGSEEKASEEKKSRAKRHKKWKMLKKLIGVANQRPLRSVS